MSLLSIVGIQDALAAGAKSGTHQGGLLSVLPMLVAFVLLFYFLLIRPQSKRQKAHRKLVEGITQGDEIVTTGGLLGQITKLTDDFVSLKLANNVEVTIQKQAIGMVVPKGTLKS